MFLKPFPIVLAAAVLWATALLAQPPAPSAEGGPRARAGTQNTAQAIVPVKLGLFMITGAGANSMVRVVGDWILLVDTKALGEANYNALLAQIKTVSDKPVKYVVVSDVHQDKSGNTGLFVAAGAQVIAHENEKTGLETYTNALERPPLRPSPIKPTTRSGCTTR